ncbi:hypothetical protein YH65_02800 [Sulfurovum lithotrophicum]|uniref:Uncharacterized protein n=1 Tax=Sulfurovum lithotrophicum TaxID=206403 RepID=A0A7U4RQ97_9BACT|nr:hypothetical protein [Sulfurovum lithotrophicum]AKF24441.1 hypothetical protein YH65_02800 [Sulfurovum lithotrophicum]
MKKLSYFNIPIAYLLLYTVVILATGVWLFLLSQGLNSVEGITGALKKVISTPEPKSMHNLVEVATPHLFAMGMLIFVVAHFMLFSTKISQKVSLAVAMVLFILAFFNILSYGAIAFGLVASGGIKLLTMGVFVGVFLVLLGMVAVSL